MVSFGGKTSRGKFGVYVSGYSKRDLPRTLVHLKNNIPTGDFQNAHKSGYLVSQIMKINIRVSPSTHALKTTGDDQYQVEHRYGDQDNDQAVRRKDVQSETSRLQKPYALCALQPSKMGSSCRMKEVKVSDSNFNNYINLALNPSPALSIQSSVNVCVLKRVCVCALLVRECRCGDMCVQLKPSEAASHYVGIDPRQSGMLGEEIEP
ncbi:hypothetical protein RRG08_024573 [Elysia crispata]|uniref:Uncharacterized protein n=1 Tax=Elysia crispata TaxID=231223 RepID=A0AAE0ZXI7_9GAST|nr:hypothetical protein RRG08_024573 [Elysia crispata]